MLCQNYKIYKELTWYRHVVPQKFTARGKADVKEGGNFRCKFWMYKYAATFNWNVDVQFKPNEEDFRVPIR